MADVTASRTDASATNGGRTANQQNRSAPAVPSTPPAGTVRVRLALSSAGLDDPTLVVSPAPVPTGASATGVLAQRHGLVGPDREPATILSLAGARYRLTAAGDPTDVVVEPAHPGARGVAVREVLVEGFRFEVETELERLASLRERATRDRAGAGHAGPLEIHAIIPGRVVEVWVTAGDTVTAGERVLAIEAMKMQNELLAPRDGTIARVGIALGETVEIGDLLVVME